MDDSRKCPCPLTTVGIYIFNPFLLLEIPKCSTPIPSLAPLFRNFAFLSCTPLEFLVWARDEIARETFIQQTLLMVEPYNFIPNLCFP